MGTLVFHILLITAFLLAEVDMKGSVKEEPLVIEFPDILPEEEIIKKELEENELSPENERANNLTNAASNKLSVKNNTSSTDKFFDEDYLKEVNDAKNLRSKVNNQIAKEKIKIEDIKMPVETTQGMNPDSIKNIVYTGESNITYYLENRYHVDLLPIPVYLAKGGGKIIIEIVVNRNGKVIQANPAAGNKVRDEQIVMYAQTAALRTIFNADPNAKAAQKGTIHYNFIAQ